MSSGDSSPANKRSADPEPEDQELEVGNRRGSKPSPDDGSVDFGSYVSSTIRSSADRFGTPVRSSSRQRGRKTGQEPKPPVQSDVDPAPARRPTRRAARITSDGAPAETNRPRTYWRDSVGGNSRSTEDDGRADDTTGSGNGERFGGMFPWKFPGDSRTRAIILGAVAVAVLALIVLIWFLNRDDGDESPPPTGTVESVIDAPDTPTQRSQDDSTPAGVIPFEDEAAEESPEPEPTEAVRRGGDNQLDREDPPTP